MLFTWSSTQNRPPIPVHVPTFNKCQEVIFTDKKYLTKWCFENLAVKLRWWVGVLDCLSLFKFKVYLWVIERFCQNDWKISFSWWSVFELDLFFCFLCESKIVLLKRGTELLFWCYSKYVSQFWDII